MRTAFYANIKAVKDALNTNTYTISPMSVDTADAEDFVSDLAEKALGSHPGTDPADAIAYRYALRELNPFVVTGDAALYDQHNIAGLDGVGNLDVENYSKEYLADRSKFLANITTANFSNLRVADGTAYTQSDEDIDYFDKRLNVTLHQAKPSRTKSLERADLQGSVILNLISAGIKKVTFSNEEEISGGSSDDHLYGESAANTLLGLEGMDYLVGGSGDDTLHANEESNEDDEVADTLRGGKGFDKYYAHFGDIIWMPVCA